MPAVAMPRSVGSGAGVVPLDTPAPVDGVLDMLPDVDGPVPYVPLETPPAVPAPGDALGAPLLTAACASRLHRSKSAWPAVEAWPQAVAQIARRPVVKVRAARCFAVDIYRPSMDVAKSCDRGAASYKWDARDTRRSRRPNGAILQTWRILAAPAGPLYSSWAHITREWRNWQTRWT